MTIAKVGEYRTIVPKKGVYIPMKKMASGKMKAQYLHRTKARVKATGKPVVQKLGTTTVKRHLRTSRKGNVAPVRQHQRQLMYVDRAGNKVYRQYIPARKLWQYTVRNRKGQLVNPRGSMKLIRKSGVKIIRQVIPRSKLGISLWEARR
jgi:hypothetical protein